MTTDNAHNVISDKTFNYTNVRHMRGGVHSLNLVLDDALKPVAKEIKFMRKVIYQLLVFLSHKFSLDYYILTNHLF
jgi:hypothetical protein